MGAQLLNDSSLSNEPGVHTRTDYIEGALSIERIRIGIGNQSGPKSGDL